MRKARVKKIILDSYGSFLGMEKGCFTIRDRKGEVEKYPLFEEEIGEVVLKTGNSVSVGVLASLGFWEIDTLLGPHPSLAAPPPCLHLKCFYAEQG